jgi:hypothetical protein
MALKEAYGVICTPDVDILKIYVVQNPRVSYGKGEYDLEIEIEGQREVKWVQ